jgi:hypothetical protein
MSGTGWNGAEIKFGQVCAPKGAIALSPGFQPWELSHLKLRLKGRQIRWTRLTYSQPQDGMVSLRITRFLRRRPLQGETLYRMFPGLKPHKR